VIDFDVPTDVQDLAARVRAFVVEQIVPYERDPRVTAHGPDDDLRLELVGLARAEGLLTVQAPRDLGGMGLDHRDQAEVYIASGWSTLGPVAMNCAAPDEGNMYLLARVADADQRDEHLRPLVEGRTRSAFAMTEPDGAGSDPKQLRTTAVHEGDGYRINGLKWLITGANGATTWIVMADVQPDGSGPSGPTLFLAHGDDPGLNIERVMNSMDRNYVAGHCVVRLDDLVVPESAVLGEVGAAFTYAQMRLAPARLTHCMRWLGAAERVQSIALDHARTRTAFGKPIGEHQGVGFMLADNEIAIHQCRLAVWHTAWLLDQGEKGRHESSMTKAYVSEELFKLTDRCVQVLGGIGITDETVVAQIFSDMRAFRLYDGPTEVHKHAIARQILR